MIAILIDCIIMAGSIISNQKEILIMKIMILKMLHEANTQF